MEGGERPRLLLYYHAAVLCITMALTRVVVEELEARTYRDQIRRTILAQINLLPNWDQVLQFYEQVALPPKPPTFLLGGPPDPEVLNFVFTTHLPKTVRPPGFLEFERVCPELGEGLQVQIGTVLYLLNQEQQQDVVGPIVIMNASLYINRLRENLAFGVETATCDLRWWKSLRDHCERLFEMFINGGALKNNSELIAEQAHLKCESCNDKLRLVDQPLCPTCKKEKHAGVAKAA